MNNSIGTEETRLPDSGGDRDGLAPGEMLESYRIVELLGRGGMGEVYRAENRVTSRQVALKVIAKAATRGEDFVERFRQEARVMSELEHPGIVRVHHAGEAQGRYYLTMDLVEGGTLEEYRGQRSESSSADPAEKLSETQIRDIALQICDALAYAHGKGIVHRDLKPANILVEVQGSGFEVGGVQGSGFKVQGSGGAKTLNRGEGGTLNFEPKIRITDFGLAKVVGEDFVSEVIKKSVSLSMGRSIGEMPTVPGSKRAAYEGTSTGAILGTYAYMSPEQKAGGEVTKQSDIYSVGIILYWLLTGRKPEGMAKPPSHFGCSPMWDPIVAKCLEHDFQERYGSAEEVAGDLKNMGLGAGGRGKKRQGAGGMGQGKRRGSTDGRGWTRMGWGLVVGCLVLVVAWLGMGRDGRPLGPSGPQIEPIPLATAVPVPEVPMPEPPPRREGVVLVDQVFEVEPPGTRMAVFGAGGLVLQTNVMNRVTLRLEPGTYEIELQKDGYELLKQGVRVEEGGGVRDFDLVPLRGELRLLSTAGAEVVAVRVGSSSPVALGRVGEDGVLRYDRLVEGEYTLNVAHPDYVERSERVEIRKDRSAALTAPLTGKPGWVWINTSPRAEVWLGERRLGETGTRIEGIPAGPHTLEIRQSGFRRERVEIEMPPNGFVRESLPNLSRESGAVRVTLEVPEYAHEFFRTSEVELRVGSETRKASGQAEWTLEGLPVGEVEVRVQGSGFAEGRGQRVEVRDGERAEVRFVLEPLPARVTVTGAPSVASVRLPDGTSVSAGSEIAVPSLQAVTLHVSAPRHQEAVVQVPVLRPGERHTVAVRMEEIRDPTAGNVLGMRFVEVEPGSFRMGSVSGGRDNERPVREVRITRGFWMGVYEVTQREYEALMGNNPSQFKGDGNRPVELVSWHDAVAFCVRLTERERAAGRLPAGYVYRLPTEAEWEYAARGGQRARETTYAGSNNLDEVAWHRGNPGNQTRPVGGKRANELGLHDMSGNVWEWVHDWYQDSYRGLGAVDPTGPANGSNRVNRGGSWDFDPSRCRVAYRASWGPARTSSNLGFRVVLAPQFR